MTATRARRSVDVPTGSDIPQRRRGATLERAILDAAFAELTECGYLGFSVEAVAARARTGKASIYRRWPTKQELVLDALAESLPEPTDCGIDPDLDDSVTTAEALLGIGRAIGATISSPAGDAVRAIKCEAMTDPELAALVDARFQAPRRAALLALLQRGVERGEVRPGAATTVVADVLPALLLHQGILQREPIAEHHIIAIMRDVIIPLVEVR